MSRSFLDLFSFVSLCADCVFLSLCILFFFSSRRRHTRCALVTGVQTCALPISLRPNLRLGDVPGVVQEAIAGGIARLLVLDPGVKIGRASCRERVCQYV